MSEDSSEKSGGGRLTESLTGKKKEKSTKSVKKDKREEKGAGGIKEMSGEKFKRMIALLLGARVISEKEHGILLKEAKETKEKIVSRDSQVLKNYEKLERQRLLVLWAVFEGEEISNDLEEKMVSRSDKKDEVREIIKIWNEVVEETKKTELTEVDYGNKYKELEDKGINSEGLKEKSLKELMKEYEKGYLLFSTNYEVKGGVDDSEILLDNIIKRKYEMGIEGEEIFGEDILRRLKSEEYKEDNDNYKWLDSGLVKMDKVVEYLKDIDESLYPNSDVKKKWESYLDSLVEDVSVISRGIEKYRHYKKISMETRGLLRVNGFKRMLRMLRERERDFDERNGVKIKLDGKRGERQEEMIKAVLLAATQGADREQRGYSNKFNWALGEYSLVNQDGSVALDVDGSTAANTELESMIKVIYKSGDLNKPAEQIIRLIKEAKGWSQDGADLQPHQLTKMMTLRMLIENGVNHELNPGSSKEMVRGGVFNLLSEEEREEMLGRLGEYVGGLSAMIEEMQKTKTLPRKWKSASEYMVQGARAGLGRMMPPQEMLTMQEGLEGGEEQLGRAMYAIPENLIKKHLTVRKDLGETPDEAVERGLNTFLETAADERSLVYFSSHINNFLAGEEGNIDQPLHLLYHAAKGHEGLYKVVTGITQTEDLLRVGSAMSAGTDDDLVERKDFKKYGGVQGFRIWDENIKDEGGEKGKYSEKKTNEQQKFFSVGPFDVVDALSDNYWYSAFQDKGRGYDQHPKRHKMMAEVMFMNLGGKVKMIKMENNELERRYFIKGALDTDKKKQYGLSMDEMLKTELKFGKQMKIAKMKDPRTLDFDYVYTDKVNLQELAKSHLWMTMLGEAQWELSGRRAVMDRFIDGRRNIYQWDKLFNYDVYGGKLGGHRGFPAFVMPDEKPILDLNRSDYVSKYVKKMGAFLFNEGDFVRVDSRTGKPVPNSGVDGVKTNLADGDAELARRFVKLMNKKFIDPHKAVKDQDLFRSAFVTENEMAQRLGMKDRGNVKKFIKELKKSMKNKDKDNEKAQKSSQEAQMKFHQWQRWQTARFEDKDINLINEMRWDKLLNYLVGSDKKNPSLENDDYRHWPPRITAEERNYVFEELMDREYKTEKDAKGNVKGWEFKGKEKDKKKAQEEAAKWFFEHYSDRYYFWGRLEHNQHLKEANYTRQAAAQAPKMLRFNEQPTADNLLEWTLPMFGFNPGTEVREIAYNAAQWNLRLLGKRPLAEMGAIFYSDKKPGLFKLWSNVFGKPSLAEAKARGVGPIDYADQIDKHGYPKMRPRNFWKRPGESLMIMFKGAGQLKGHKALDAWARKYYIEKLWHAGGIEWIHKEALMAEFVIPGALGTMGRGLSRMINIEKSKLLKSDFFMKDKPLNRVARTLVILASRYPALAVARAIQWPYLNIWIHDWAAARTAFWNEVVAPAMFGENAQAAQM